MPLQISRRLCSRPISNPDSNPRPAPPRKKFRKKRTSPPQHTFPARFTTNPKPPTVTLTAMWKRAGAKTRSKQLQKQARTLLQGMRAVHAAVAVAAGAEGARVRSLPDSLPRVLRFPLPKHHPDIRQHERRPQLRFLQFLRRPARGLQRAPLCSPSDCPAPAKVRGSSATV